MFGKLTRSEIEEVLRQEVVGRPGCHADGITYVVPVSYAYDFMRKNPSVCFQVDRMPDGHFPSKILMT